MYTENKINRAKYEECLWFISRDKVHVEMRNLIMMVLLPKKLHFDDNSQSAFLRAAISRMANKTVIEEEGIWLLRPVYHLLFDSYYLGFDLSKVIVCYETYTNNFKTDSLHKNVQTIENAVDKGICPGKTKLPRQYYKLVFQLVPLTLTV